jgi:hypothetical protein
MTDQTTNTTYSSGSPLERHVRPAAWRWGVERLRGRPEWRYSIFQTRKEAVPLYDQAALDAALNLWPRDCRLCANYTTKTGGCISVVQCVDSAQFKATAPRQYWVTRPNVGIEPPRSGRLE